MIQRKPLKDIHKAIRAKIREVLEQAPELEEIKRIVYGEKVRVGTLQTPAIWIVPEPYAPNLLGGHTADHDIRFNFVVLVKDSDPEQGLEKAHDLALTVYDVLMQDRTLGGTVSDVRPTQIDPAYEMGNNTQVCWSAVQFDFRVKRRE
ncbi:MULTISPECIES: hypothetical protein [Geobacillus]|uniref:Tail terminator n=1 Tax=Geobacillus thermodenitrificans TaxID=33940 RepID=A0ABY9Q9V1_GEOTD|nr:MULTISPECIES: hypothetical protein [Geobacillus]ATA61157.1 hypothetical protein GS458_2721 [Geobacillus stearothermophilus]KOR93970.1 hypothetical protein N231_09830 [Geobacillus stearothermophilus ATCC 12980]MED3843319.1 hypothetical protein [Geobacillus stearothermophilus]MED4356540.1 hypothetical protein [Geobacillus stearothermophilus]MED4881329.1 hypothetical protein [Geobacillus stearothermophilus]